MNQSLSWTMTPEQRIARLEKLIVGLAIKHESGPGDYGYHDDWYDCGICGKALDTDSGGRPGINPNPCACGVLDMMKDLQESDPDFLGTLFMGTLL